MDRIDKKILNLLQADAGMAVADIAKEVGLTVTPCWQRIKRLYAGGVIRRRVALLDPIKVGAGISVFVTIRTNEHDADWLGRFAKAVAPMPEVVEFYRMSGEADYLLRVVVPDIESYDAFYKKLIAQVKLSDVSSSFAMEQIKYTTMLPISLPHANIASDDLPDGKKLASMGNKHKPKPAKFPKPR
ncbi:MAG: Lrp/AsnC family transcriptional regulator [Proteobacteria bacterium]|nr:Lrp/AsnC family transcriptional regulator [Pseudomonadota bacterium]